MLLSAHADLAISSGWFEKECPRHLVTVPAYAISRVPVTAGEWNVFAAASGIPAAAGDDRLPVSGIGWVRAQEFCRWFSGEYGFAVTLPSESQWERAARGDDAREYPWGDSYEPGRANLADLGVGGPLPVGNFPAGASPFGVLDLAGNVDEWTSTVYAPYPGAPAAVPDAEPWAADVHVTRGGSWIHHRDLARCARRHGAYGADLRGVGFRLAAPFTADLSGHTLRRSFSVAQPVQGGLP